MQNGGFESNVEKGPMVRKRDRRLDRCGPRPCSERGLEKGLDVKTVHNEVSLTAMDVNENS